MMLERFLIGIKSEKTTRTARAIHFFEILSVNIERPRQQ